MVKKKDRNESTTVILREFNCELIEKLKKFTNEKTASKAIMLVCARYLSIEKLADEQREKIDNLESDLSEIKSLIRDHYIASESIKRFIGIKGD
ncbi:hypothetical protein K9K77_03585 [Candidatus Babeliales bacterium]|nr:hypothetical protein [Candidatus Babeliales bacterium]